MTREKEIAIVQYFYDMEVIEDMAGDLFREQRRRATDPTLKKIFSTFVADEDRHARVAARLARYFDVHHYQEYEACPYVTRFRPHFIRAIQSFSAEIANILVTFGEIFLDVALLRSIDDYVDDEMSKQAMARINRDESRHIAIDYHMVEYYASPAYLDWLEQQPRPSLRTQAKAWAAFGRVLMLLGPYVSAVFFEPMKRTDPSGKRLREALKRSQLLLTKPEVARRPFVRLMNVNRVLYNNRVIHAILGKTVQSIAGLPDEFLATAHTEDEARRASAMSYEELAQEALGAKFSN